MRIPDYPPTRGAYVRMTGALRDVVDRLPGRAKLLKAPTIFCAALYVLSLLVLLLLGDPRVVRAVFVPAACFLMATALRPLIGRQRPYDRFDAPPVGPCQRGKGRSMPSRHAASAAAIACAVVYAFPSVPMGVLMALMSLLIAALRVLSGQHYLSDVLAALALSVSLSLIGYVLL